MGESTDLVVGVSPQDVVEVVAAALSAEGDLSPQSFDRFVDLMGRFAAFVSTAYDVADLRSVTSAMASEFVVSPSTAGAPTASVQHFRRSAVRMMFRVACELGMADGDPTLDLQLPGREVGVMRALMDEETELCRLSSVSSLDETRLPVAWALAEASARSSELSEITPADVDLDARKVWLHGGSKVDARWAPLSSWGAFQVARRLDVLDGADRPLTYEGSGSPQSRQAAACIAISTTLTRAGLGDAPGVRPLSVTAWAGQQVMAESGCIAAVARRLGMRSLDRTARLIGFDWQKSAVWDGDR